MRKRQRKKNEKKLQSVHIGSLQNLMAWAERQIDAGRMTPDETRSVRAMLVRMQDEWVAHARQNLRDYEGKPITIEEAMREGLPR